MQNANVKPDLTTAPQDKRCEHHCPHTPSDAGQL